MFKESEQQQQQAGENIGKCNNDQQTNQAKQFVEDHSVLSKIKKSVPTFKPPQCTLSCFTGGKCITEDSVLGNIEKRISDQKNRGKNKITNACNNNQPVSENPGSSHATPVKKFDQKVAQQHVSATKVLAKFKPS